MANPETLQETVVQDEKVNLNKKEPKAFPSQAELSDKLTSVKSMLEGLGQVLERIDAGASIFSSEPPTQEGDGIISKAEARKVFRELEDKGIKLEGKREVMDYLPAKIEDIKKFCEGALREVDSNKNGYISPNEISPTNGNTSVDKEGKQGSAAIQFLR